jgi:hypothetical protein
MSLTRWPKLAVGCLVCNFCIEVSSDVHSLELGIQILKWYEGTKSVCVLLPSFSLTNHAQDCIEVPYRCATTWLRLWHRPAKTYVPFPVHRVTAAVYEDGRVSAKDGRPDVRRRNSCPTNDKRNLYARAKECLTSSAVCIDCHLDFVPRTRDGVSV